MRFFKKIFKIFITILLPLLCCSIASSQPNKEQQEKFDGMYIEAIHVLADYDQKGMKNFDKGLSLMKKVAKLGYARAQTRLGIIYSQKNMYRYSTIDIKEAVYWFRLAAAQGDGSAQLSLAVLYMEGKPPLAKDLDMAEALFLEAKKNGIRVADDYLASLRNQSGKSAQNLAILFMNLVKLAAEIEAQKSNQVDNSHGNISTTGSGYAKPSGDCTSEYIKSRLIYCYNESFEGIDAECGSSLLDNDVAACESAVQWEMEHGVPQSYWWCDKKTHFVSPDKSRVIEKICQ